MGIVLEDGFIGSRVEMTDVSGGKPRPGKIVAVSAAGDDGPFRLLVVLDNGTMAGVWVGAGHQFVVRLVGPRDRVFGEEV